MSNRRCQLKLYLIFCRHYHLPDLPTTPRTLILYIEFLLRSYRAPGSVRNALSSVRFLHLFMGHPTDAFADFQLALSLRALPLTVRHTPHPAPPCTLRLLRAICRAVGPLGARGAVFGALCTIAFFSLARLSSLVPPALPHDPTRYPTFGDLIHTQDGILLRVKFAKNAQAADNAFLVPLLRNPDPECCPVNAINLLRRHFPNATGSTPLFPWPLPETAPGGSSSSLTAPVARRWLALALSRAGEHPQALTFHSFRRGGCTTAVLHGAQQADVQSLGHWRSDAVRHYFPSLPASTRAAHCLASATLTTNPLAN